MNDVAYKRWICDACGFIYDEAKGDPDSGLAPGTLYDDIPDDWQCPLCGLKKSDLRLLPDTPAVTTTPARSTGPSSAKSLRARGGNDAVVIVGAGVAGWSVAEAIRQRDPQRDVLLVTACKGAVYPKPAISLAISQGRSADDLIDSDAITHGAELGIEVQTDTRVLKIDTSRKRLTTTKGGIVYGKLILALGAHQRELPIEGDAADKILRVNDLHTFKKLQQRLAEGVSKVTILGAGLIGSEFADDLSSAGYKVTVIDLGSYPLSGLLPLQMANELQARLAAKGVEWHFGVSLQRVEQGGDSMKAYLSDGSSFSTDIVLSAAGLVANTKLANKSGLNVDVGIAVNSDMRTTDEHIYAIGDCASVEGRLFAFIEPIRRQANAIAADIMGEHESFMPVPPMVKVKTQTMPISVCRPEGNIEESAWQMVSHNEAGSCFEIHNAMKVIGFALSDNLASEAASHYRKLKVN